MRPAETVSHDGRQKHDVALAESIVGAKVLQMTVAGDAYQHMRHILLAD
jgi:hypothetical protein